MDKIRWGVLGTAKIARQLVIPATQQSQLGVVTAVASRDLAKARSVAAELGIERAYGSYEDLLADADVDAIYNPLPNHLHVSWSIRALAAGKHVLCEKPIGLSAAEAEELVVAAAAHPQFKVMEAFMYRFHPQWQMARELVHSGRIGQLRTIQTFFCYHNTDPKNIRNQRDIGGGVLMDIGCYAVSISRFLFSAEPLRVLGHVERDPALGIDRLASAVLEFYQGISTFTCSTQLAPYQRVNIYGTMGRIEIEVPVNAPLDRPTKIWLQRGPVAEEMPFGPCNQYTLQADAFARAVLYNAPAPTPLSDAVANMHVIERVFASAEQGGWV
jgi:predicted dehydrogenase